MPSPLRVTSFAVAALLFLGCASQPAVAPPKVSAVPVQSADVSTQTPANAPAPTDTYPTSEEALANMPPANAREPLPSHDSIDTRRAVGWTFVGVGVLGLAAALGTSGLMLHDESVRSSNCDAAKVCNSDGASANSQIGSLAGWNVATWIVGVAGVGVGAFLLLTDSNEHDRQVSVGVTPNGGGASMALKGTF
jgi:hypothetical protein